MAQSRNQFWYLGIGLLVAGFMYLALYAHDYLSAVVALVAGVAIFRVANIKPEQRRIVLDETGVYWGDTFLAYHQLRSFWLDSVEGKTMVFIERAGFGPLINFVVTDKELNQVQTLLGQHLPLHGHRREPLSDKFARFFKL